MFLQKCSYEKKINSTCGSARIQNFREFIWRIFSMILTELRTVTFNNTNGIRGVFKILANV